MSFRLSSLFGAIVLLSCAGCVPATWAGFRGDNWDDSFEWPPSPSSNPASITVRVDIEGSREERAYACGFWAFVPYADSADNCSWSWQEETERAYRESGLFSDVRSGDAPADLYADVRIELVHGRRGAPAFAVLDAAVLMLLLLPAKMWQEDAMMRTVFRDSNGTVLSNHRRSVRVSTWGHLLMPFLYPFRGSEEAALADACCDLSRAVIAEARAQGTLK